MTILESVSTCTLLLVVLWCHTDCVVVCGLSDDSLLGVQGKLGGPSYPNTILLKQIP